MSQTGSHHAEKLGEPLYHQPRASIVYEPRQQGKATVGVEKGGTPKGGGEGMIVLVAIVTVVAGRVEIFLVFHARTIERGRV
jgi:hypothetical protein